MAKRKLNQAFIDQMFAPTIRTPKNLGRMKPDEIRREYTKQAKAANKRIKAIERAGLYSPAVSGLADKGITYFGLKNENLTTDAEIREAYRTLMNFLGSTTSTRTGVKATLDKIVKNFDIDFDGDYAQLSQKATKIFDLYEDLREMAKQGHLKSGDKYDIINDLSTLYDEGLIDKDTSASELLERLNAMAGQRAEEFRARQKQLRFNWTV